MLPFATNSGTLPLELAQKITEEVENRIYKFQTGKNIINFHFRCIGFLILISIEFFVAANSEKSSKIFEKSLKYSKMVH